MPEKSRKPISDTSRKTILKRMLRIAEKDGRDDLANGYTPFVDKFVFSNSYSVYVLGSSFDYAPMQNPLRAQTLDFCSQTKANAAVHTIRVDRDALRSITKQAKSLSSRTQDDKLAKGKALRTTLTDGDFKITFNAMYLLDLVNMFDAEEIYCDDHPFHPAVVYGRNGEWGLLCPIRAY